MTVEIYFRNGEIKVYGNVDFINVNRQEKTLDVRKDDVIFNLNAIKKVVVNYSVVYRSED